MDPRSLHERIAADLRAQILSGDLAPASALPSTAQLKNRFDASNATIQKALQLLKSEELVVGRAGASVTVRARRQRTVRPSSYLTDGASGTPSRWLAETDDEAPPARSELLDVAECVPPADVGAVLGTGEPDLAVRRRQLLLLGEDPAELVTSYYPAALARGTALTVRRKIRGGAPAVLAELGDGDGQGGASVRAGVRVRGGVMSARRHAWRTRRTRSRLLSKPVQSPVARFSPEARPRVRPARAGSA